MPYEWLCEPTRQITILLQDTRLRDYGLIVRAPWEREPQPEELLRFEDADGEMEVELTTETGEVVAKMWIAFVEDADPDGDPLVAELRGWHLMPGWA